MRSYLSSVRSQTFLFRILSFLFTVELCSNRLSRVCRLWWEVSTGPLLWHTVDLTTGRVKEAYRSERQLVWLLQNRLSRVQDLALGERRQSHFLKYFILNIIFLSCS